MFTKCEWLICLLSLLFVQETGTVVLRDSHSLDSVASFNTFVPCKLDVGFKAWSDSGSGCCVLLCFVLIRRLHKRHVYSAIRSLCLCVSSPWRSMPRSRRSSETAESLLSHSVTSSCINWNSSIIRHFLFLPLGTQWYSSFRKGEDLTYVIYLKYLIFN